MKIALKPAESNRDGILHVFNFCASEGLKNTLVVTWIRNKTEWTEQFFQTNLN